MALHWKAFVLLGLLPSFLPPMKYSLGSSLIVERSKFGARGAIKPPRPNERQNDWAPNEREANDDGIIM